MITIIKEFIKPYLTYIRIGLATVLAVAIIAFFGYFVYLHHEVKDLKTTNIEISAKLKISDDNLAVATANANKCYESNAENKKTISKLLVNQELSVQEMKNLVYANEASKKQLKNLNSKINEMAKDPSNDGEISPILKETLRTLKKVQTP
jgi:Tfp pilus assembly protein PilO